MTTPRIPAAGRAGTPTRNATTKCGKIKKTNTALGPAVPYREHHRGPAEVRFHATLEALYREHGLGERAVIQDLLPLLTPEQRQQIRAEAAAANMVWPW